MLKIFVTNHMVNYSNWLLSLIFQFSACEENKIYVVHIEINVVMYEVYQCVILFWHEELLIKS